MLELLGAEPAHALWFLAAHPATGGNRCFVPAVVTAQHARRLVDGEGDGAVRALAHVTARGTLEVRRKAATVQEENDLLGAGQRPPHGLIERLGPGDSPSLRHAARAPQIDHLDRGKRPRADALRQLKGADPPRVGEV